jgi:hypothetical protein
MRKWLLKNNMAVPIIVGHRYPAFSKTVLVGNHTVITGRSINKLFGGFQVSGVRPFYFGFRIVDFGFKNIKPRSHDYGIEGFWN